MNDVCVSGWPRHQLRLAFYDFAVRGEGDTATVGAVIDAWFAEGALSLAEADRWHDALEWREMGGYLPGWAVPQPANEDPFVPGEEHEALFRQWRGTRIAAAA
jgi:hypothetical protein